MNLTPLGDRVIVERDEAESVTPGGLFIPDTAKEKPARGKVVAVGPGRRMSDGSVAEIRLLNGSNVLFGSYAGVEVEIDNRRLVILREDEIMSVVD